MQDTFPVEVRRPSPVLHWTCYDGGTRNSSFVRTNLFRRIDVYGRWLLYVCRISSFCFCTGMVSGYVAHVISRMRIGGARARSGVRTGVGMRPECTRYPRRWG